MRLAHKILAILLVAIVLAGGASAQFGPRNPPGQAAFAAPTVLTADELVLRDQKGRPWRVIVRGGQLVVVPAGVRPQGGPRRW